MAARELDGGRGGGADELVDRHQLELGPGEGVDARPHGGEGLVGDAGPARRERVDHLEQRDRRQRSAQPVAAVAAAAALGEAGAAEVIWKPLVAHLLTTPALVVLAVVTAEAAARLLPAWS